MKYLYKYITEKIKQDFHKKYEVKDDCWIWNKYKDSDGYGQIHLKYDDGKHNMCRAHRVSWMIHNQSDWPTSLPVARHTCNNPNCVNPEHVIPGTHQQNSQDMIDAGRHPRNMSNNKPVITPLGTFESGRKACEALGISQWTLINNIRKKKEGYDYV